MYFVRILNNNNGLIQRYKFLFVMEPKLVGNNAVAAIKY